MEIEHITELLKQQKQQNGVTRIDGENQNYKYKAYFLQPNKIRIDLEEKTTNQGEDE